ncbi:sn-glycerol-1-phosphate dehydrogenase [Apibacter muscae]|uniref:sn-glycerol-1-phosphate dehydrogenase n=1 Tax=Apibacter muscae TaxID=2509004 RepID=A0A563DFE7_9FLAO|nr:sn-glycerol-1-phosphate dehydrogenase [Apibacter muscae]TWP28797.1 sn-glycerol-1-phosphate dehydrogenase [Apibacter muscae]TWP29952.1 sn-glycerol-1-phosphate dehydrogenase [Apibacter muscae]
MSKESIASALKQATETKFLEIESGILNQVPKIFSEQFPGKKGIIIADPNTYRVAGEEIHEELKKAGLEGESPYILDDPNLYADYIFVEKIRDYLKDKDVTPIAVGSGVINDLVKRASSELKRKYMCVATAASMDGYSSAGASITNKGAKITHACEAPQVLVADIDIIAAAPPLMTASGYADLYAKVVSGADWLIAAELYDEKNPKKGIEPLTSAWHTVQDGLAESLSDPEGAKNGNAKAIELLTEGLMLGGFAMQSMESWGAGVSRPASGAEHQFSHLWDMEHHTFQGEMAKRFGLYPNQDEQAPSHGFKVGIGTLAITALYEVLLKTPIENLDIEAAVEKWPTLEDQLSEINEMFGGTEILPFAINQTTDKYVTKEELREQLTKIKNNWPSLKEKIQKQIIPFNETKRRLSAVGAPVEPEEIGITRDRLKKSFYRAHKIRSRYTILDFAYRAGYLDQWVDELFNSGVLKG